MTEHVFKHEYIRWYWAGVMNKPDTTIKRIDLHINISLNIKCKALGYINTCDRATSVTAEINR
ncbi:hypothetical protein EA58_05855 [Photobacterium galatheae]|uniref:Uncharacterized protein n=1 Tax=Photobacterium galatheae TaxID=1654360 RepID=A0A066RQ15_9GAMM|nr:hypothetical protein EA58_05855 [Photobacterium galatheae]